MSKNTNGHATPNKLHHILILGAHPNHGYSMRQYSTNLLEAYRTNGYSAHLCTPDRIAFNIELTPTLKKLVFYFEKLVIFPLQLRSKIRRYTRLGTVGVHIADHSDAFWLLFPWIRQHSTAVTCHDLIAIRAAQGQLPEHRPRILGRNYQGLILKGLSQADRVCPVSRTTEADCKKLLPDVPRFYLPNPVRLASKDASTEFSRNPRFKPYALVVSTTGWRKRRHIALRIWSMLTNVDSHHKQLHLVLVGPPLNKTELSEIRPSQLELVHVVSDIADEMLSDLYAGADFTIQSSKYEGFGLPVIESNAHGTPVLCADEAIFREVGAPNVFFDSSLANIDPQEIMERLNSLKNSRELAENASRYSKENFIKRVGQLAPTLRRSVGNF
jgi:glycosyltransferase involved in cell wall biosynthesis